MNEQIQLCVDSGAAARDYSRHEGATMNDKAHIEKAARAYCEGDKPGCIDWTDPANLGVTAPMRAHFRAGWQAALAEQPAAHPESFEQWFAKQHGDPEEIGFLQAMRITYEAGQASVNAVRYEQPAEQPAVLHDDLLESLWRVSMNSSADNLPMPFARAILARAVPPGHVVVKDEPVAWLSIDRIGERYLCFSKPEDDDEVHALYARPGAPK